MKKTLLFLSLCVGNIILAQTYQVTTVAGNGISGFIDGAALSTCEISGPYGVTTDNDSCLYFSDLNNNSIRKLNINSGIVTTIAGFGSSGFQDGPLTTSKFYAPDQLVYKNGFLYIADNGNNRIRMVDLSSNTASTIAGNGVYGYLDGPVTQAQFRAPSSIAIDNNGDIYVTDGYNHCIRKISGGQVTTIAGVAGSSGHVNGAASQAKFNRPRCISISNNGDLFITDMLNNRVRKLSAGIVSDFSGSGIAGGTDGTSTAASFNVPVGIVTTFDNYLYVVDGVGYKIRKIDSLGNVVTVAGTGSYGYANGLGINANFALPQGLCYDNNGFLYIADRDNNRIRKIDVPEVLSVNNIASESLRTYPNPTTNILNISLSEFSKDCSYKIYDMIGIQVKSGDIKSITNQINLEDLSNGIYYIVISSNEKTTKPLVSKIILQK